MKRFLTLALILSLAGNIFGQTLNGVTQNPISAHYNMMPFVYNPAFTGLSEHGELFVSGQNLAALLDSLQYSSDLVAVHAKVPGFDGGVGGKLIYVYFPGRRYVTLSGDFSYVLWRGEESGKLAVGGSVGLGVADAVISTGLISENRLRVFPDFGAGIAFTYEGLALGAGGRHLGRPMVNYTSSNGEIIDDVFYMSGAYGFVIDGIEFTPSFLGRWRNSGYFLTDFQLGADFDDKFGLGLGYRVDLRRISPPNPSNPIVFQRFKVFLASAQAGINNQFFIRATYSNVLNQFTLNPNNIEVSVSYRFKSADAPNHDL